MEDDAEKCRKEGQCFTCNKQGHISRNCPDKKNKPQVKACKAETEDSGNNPKLSLTVREQAEGVQVCGARKWLYRKLASKVAAMCGAVLECVILQKRVLGRSGSEMHKCVK